MKPSIQKLQKFFKLEAERGYDNHAVLGGLERMLDRWEAEARADELPEELIQAIVTRIRDYARLTEKSRAETLQGLWKRIQRSDAESSAETPFTGTTTGTAIAPEPEETPDQNAITAPIEPPAPQAENIAPPASAQIFPSEITGGNVARSHPARSSSTQTGKPAALDAPVTVLQGIGPRNAQTLGRLGLHTLRDMLYYFPRRYDDYTNMKPINRLWYGEEVTVIGSVENITTRPVRGGKMQLVEAILDDGSGSLRINWFNQVWVTRRLHTGMQIVVSGKVEQYLGRLVMNNPEWEQLEQEQLNTNRIVPVYGLTAQITQRWLRRMMNQVVTYWAPRVQDSLPAGLLQSAELVDLPTALQQAHFPDNSASLKAAQSRLAFDEILLLQLGVLSQKRAWQERTARAFPIDQHWLDNQIARLPFSLTGAQQHALEDVCQDLQSGRPMNRLIQGDVGSGKTIIAALAAAAIAQHGAQAAFMAPTSILAEQHYHSILRMLTSAGGEESSDSSPVDAPMHPDQICLLVSATPESEKRQIRAGLADGTIKLVIGTHALLEGPVTFADLQLVVVDEQHRFGVEQRSILRSKGENPHLLVMTATPIPRSLALTIYGDLDLSVMDEMPPGRQPVATYVLLPRERERAYSLIRSQIDLGRQAFIIYPLVEESEDSSAKAAVEEQVRLQKEIFPNLNVGLLHGRMRPDEKENIMSDFRQGKNHILVSTTVVEVGVDIPNATVMLIEGASRFGLAQLHQLRGRVGRSGEKSYCLLIPDSPDGAENERLQVMTSTNDGFILAERDLEQRGPGQFLGTRQSGFAELQFAKLTDVHLIEKARRHAQALFEADPDLKLQQHQLLASALQRFWGGGKSDIS